MSHLACADEPDHPLNAEQLARFRAALAPACRGAPASLANSSGIFLGRRLPLRPGPPGRRALRRQPPARTAQSDGAGGTLQARILQIRRIDSPRTVGYGATHRVARPSRIATIALGYADGYLRSLSNRGSCLYRRSTGCRLWAASRWTRHARRHRRAREPCRARRRRRGDRARTSGRRRGRRGRHHRLRDPDRLGRRYQRRYLGASA